MGMKFFNISKGSSKAFWKAFGRMKPKKGFENSIMNCIMIVLIKLYSSRMLLNQESKTDDEEPLILVVASWL